MRKFTLYALAGSLFLTTSLGIYAASTPHPIPLPAAHPSHTQKIELLFVMQANHAVISQTAEGLKISLSEVNGKTLYFSDRPVRKAGVLPTDKFIAHWMKPGSSFQRIPPNAAIIFDEMPIEKNGITRAKVVKLENPVAIGDHSWSFKMSDLSGKLAPGSYSKVSIFIDDSSYVGGSQDLPTEIGFM